MMHRAAMAASGPYGWKRRAGYLLWLLIVIRPVSIASTQYHIDRSTTISIEIPLGEEVHGR
jgi:hypothetical protein